LLRRNPTKNPAVPHFAQWGISQDFLDIGSVRQALEADVLSDPAGNYNLFRMVPV
jgi:hypothetical protein